MATTTEKASEGRAGAVSARLTAEQEAEARTFADSDEPIEMRRENMLAAFLRRDGRQRTARLLAELDAVRAERDRLAAARDAVASIIGSNENAPRDPFYEAKVREIGAHSCGAIMRAARHVWLDMLRDEHGLADGAHSIAPALPVLRRVLDETVAS